MAWIGQIDQLFLVVFEESLAKLYFDIIWHPSQRQDVAIGLEAAIGTLKKKVHDSWLRLEWTSLISSWKLWRTVEGHKTGLANLISLRVRRARATCKWPEASATCSLLGPSFAHRKWSRSLRFAFG